MWDPGEVERVEALGRSLVGRTKYAIGGPDGKGGWIVRGKPAFNDPAPALADCSGWSRWLIGQGRSAAGRVELPHGCLAQHAACLPVPGEPLPMDLGFADLRGGDDLPDHVVVLLSNAEVIESRGAPHGGVILRPRAVWEKQKGWQGWRRVPGVRDAV